MFCVALESFLGKVVEHMSKHLAVYSGSVIRGDGNYDVASRIVVRDGSRQTRPYSVVLAWVLVDGSLLQPMVASKAEDIKDILLDLDPLVEKVKAARLDSSC